MRKMKNSGVAWIGNVPENWEIVKIGQLFQCRNVKVNDTDFQPLSVSKGGIVPQMENVAKSDANDNRKQVLTGDFVINSRSDRKQSCGVSKLDGSVSLINTVLYGFDKDRVIPEYNNYERAQRLIHITVSRTKKIKPVTLDFSKINTAGNGVAGAKLTLSSNTSGITLSSNSLTSAGKDGKFGEVTVTPTTNKGSFKINLTEVAPKGYFGIPNDIVLTVSYNTGSVTRNESRDI